MKRVKWKGPFIQHGLLKQVKNSKKFSKNSIKTVSKNSTILPKFIGITLRAYNGKTFTILKIIEEMVGHKIGEFVSTRKQFSYKKKKKKKKLKMGQKTDARIFRQGVLKKDWDLKYIAKNNEESSLYLYKTLEIQKYLNRFFELYRIKVHNCQILYSDTSLQIFVSFYLTTKTISIITKRLTKYSKKLTTPRKRRSVKKKSKTKFKSPKPKVKLETKSFQKIKNKKNVSLNSRSSCQTVGLKGLQEILIESLATYTKNKINISVTLQSINRSKQLSYDQIKNFKIVFKQLRKFVRNPFFKEAINILFINISKRKSAKLLADFLSNHFKLNQLKTDQMTISRKDNYFLGFLKQTILLLIKSHASRLTGMKIVVKGRFNKAPRAKTSIIHVGKFSLQTFNSKVDYHQSTAYTINGTFGVKVWLCENDY